MARRYLLPWVLACAAHGAAFIALRAIPLRAPSAIITETAAEADVYDIDPDVQVGVPVAPPSSPVQSAQPAPAEPRPGVLSAGGRARVLAAKESEIAASAAGAKVDTHVESKDPLVGPVEPGAPSDWSFSPVTPLAGGGALDTRLAAASVGDVRADRSRSTAEPPANGASTTGGIGEALIEHDVGMGLGRGGPVLAAAEDAAHGPDAPLEGHATLDIAIREGGALDARVVDASSDEGGWARVASALRHIDPRKLRLPPGSHGWHVVVRLEAKVQFPDGRDPHTLHGFRGTLTPSALSDALDGKPDARGSSTAPGGPDSVGGGPSEPPPVGGVLGTSHPPNPAVGAGIGALMRVLPTPTLGMQGKVCSVALTVTPLGIGLGGGCSPENIGAGTTRIVSGRIVSESAL